MSGPKVFISYSHKDETWKDQLVRQLRVLERDGLSTSGTTGRSPRVTAGGPRSRRPMDEARVAVLLISADFLDSDFILETEVPRLLQHRAKDGLRIIPLIVRPCAWQAFDWLASIESRPRNGRALSKGRKAKVEEDLAELALEVRALLNPDLGHKPKVVEGLAPSRAGGRVPSFPSTRPSPDPRLDLGRLPIPGPHFVGRDAELARLDAAWEDPAIHVLTLVAFGGVGKSALVARWLDRMAADDWRGAARVLDWSFYSQGTKDQATSAEPFIDHALRFFGDPDPQSRLSL